MAHCRPAGLVVINRSVGVAQAPVRAVPLVNYK
jgi:hypothetical protein